MDWTTVPANQGSAALNLPFHSLGETKVMRSEGEQFLGVTESAGHTGTEAPSRCPALRIVAGIYRTLAVLVGIAAIVVMAIGLRTLDGGSEGILLVLGGFLGGLIGVATILAAAEGIRMFLDIEENTCNTYCCIWNQQNKQ